MGGPRFRFLRRGTGVVTQARSNTGQSILVLQIIQHYLTTKDARKYTYLPGILCADLSMRIKVSFPYIPCLVVLQGVRYILGSKLAEDAVDSVYVIVLKSFSQSPKKRGLL